MPLYVFPSFGLSFRSKEKKTAEKNNKAIEAEIKKQRRKKSSVILVLGIKISFYLLLLSVFYYYC